MAVDPEPLHLYMYDEYKVGMRLLFGGYEQNGSDNDGKEDIEWLVLDIVD